MRRQQEIQNLSSNENFGLNDIINEKKYCNFGNTSAFVSTEGVRQLITKGATSLIADLVIYKRNNGTLRNTDWLQAKFYRSERKEGGTLVINDDHGKVLFTKQYTFTDLPAGHYTIQSFETSTRTTLHVLFYVYQTRSKNMNLQKEKPRKEKSNTIEQRLENSNASSKLLRG